MACIDSNPGCGNKCCVLCSEHNITCDGCSSCDSIMYAEDCNNWKYEEDEE